MQSQSRTIRVTLCEDVEVQSGLINVIFADVSLSTAEASLFVVGVDCEGLTKIRQCKNVLSCEIIKKNQG